MIISRTPLRINFCGGATDQKSYCENYGGIVLNATINKYVYVIAKERIDNEIWLKYSENEIVKKIDEIKNEVWRECLRDTGIVKGAEIVAMSDIPKGYGLGGSSAFTVGSLSAFHGLMGKHISRTELAKEATEIGRKTSKLNGFQDYYTSSYGGFNTIEFGKEDTIVKPIIIPQLLKKSLSENLLLFDIGTKEGSNNLLQNQDIAGNVKEEITHKIKKIVYATRDALHSSDLTRFGELLHENWEYKKKIIKNISNPKIEEYYNLARKAGAIGGKICGTDTKGFLLFYVEPEKQDKVRSILNLKEIPFEFELGQSGSKIIYVGD